MIVLIHGITGRSEQWEPAIEHLAADHTVLAPDLLGHGESAKPRGDYSLGAYASARPRHRWSRSATTGRRSSATRSAAGSRCSSPTSSRSAASGSCWSRAAGSGARSIRCCAPRPCPGSELVMPWLHPRAGARRRRGRRPRLLGFLRLQAGTDLAEVARGFASLGDAEARVGVHRDDARGARPGRPAGLARSTASTWPRRCPRCSSGARPTRSSRPTTAAPRTRRCRAAGSSCSRASATSPSSSARTSSPRLLAEFVAETEPAGARHRDDARAPAVATAA